MTISPFLLRQKRSESEARAQLSVIRNKPCPVCAADAPIAAWFKSHRWTVECESPSCPQQPSVSANGRDEAWILWNGLSMEEPDLEAVGKGGLK